MKRLKEGDVGSKQPRKGLKPLRGLRPEVSTFFLRQYELHQVRRVSSQLKAPCPPKGE